MHVTGQLDLHPLVVQSVGVLIGSPLSIVGKLPGRSAGEVQMLWTTADEQRLDQRLRDLLVLDEPLERAIRTLHEVDGIGKLIICHAVERVLGRSATEAKRSVNRACPSKLIE